MLNISHLTKSFGNIKAVDDLTLNVANELFVFLGPNGAGKTTSIKMMTGLLTPDSGTVTLNDISLNDSPIQAKRLFGYVSETPTLYDKLTIVEFLDFIMTVYNVSYEAGRNRMLQLFDIFEITERANDLIEELSGGMKKKVSLIAALLHQPEILFLDEPTSALDPKAARNLKDMLRGFVQKGKTVFMTTHILEVAETMCDRVGIINQGKLCALGTLDELRREYGTDLSLEDVFLKITGESVRSKVDEFLKDE